MNKKYKDGGVYEGDGTLFTKKRHGKGKMVYANGDIYEGEWVDDVRSGQGTLTRKKYLSQNYCYTGEWKNDMQNGKGTLTEGNRIYEGDFVNGKYEGKGRLTKKVGSYSYEGDFKGGYKEGNGTESALSTPTQVNLCGTSSTATASRFFQTRTTLTAGFPWVFSSPERVDLWMRRVLFMRAVFSQKTSLTASVR